MRKPVFNSTKISVNNSITDEPLEVKIFKIVNSKEPISSEAELTYTDKNDGVRPEFNVRTDKFDLAIDAMDKVAKSEIAKSKEAYRKKNEPEIKKVEIDKIEPTPDDLNK